MIQIDMPMPEKCGLCPCFHFENQMYCQAVKADKNKKIVAPYGAPRPEWCPLKEQEAMEPIEEFRKGANCHVYHCKRCGNIVGTILGGKHPITKLSIEHFCDVCGQAVKWE